MRKTGTLYWDPEERHRAADSDATFSGPGKQRPTCFGDAPLAGANSKQKISHILKAKCERPAQTALHFVKYFRRRKDSHSRNSFLSQLCNARSNFFTANDGQVCFPTPLFINTLIAVMFSTKFQTSLQELTLNLKLSEIQWKITELQNSASFHWRPLLQARRQSGEAARRRTRYLGLL